MLTHTPGRIIVNWCGHGAIAPVRLSTWISIGDEGEELWQAWLQLRGANCSPTSTVRGPILGRSRGGLGGATILGESRFS